MKDLIGREALLQQIGEKLNVLRGCNDFKEAWGMRYAMVMIQNAPAVDAVEVVHAKWVSVEDKPHMIYACSQCGDKWGYGAMLHCNYCPNCGARMDGE